MMLAREKAKSGTLIGAVPPLAAERLLGCSRSRPKDAIVDMRMDLVAFPIEIRIYSE